MPTRRISFEESFQDVPRHFAADGDLIFFGADSAKIVSDALGALRLKLGQDLFSDRLELVAGETKPDAIYGCAMVASARASVFGRAPVGPDLDLALTLFGYLGGAPQDLIDWRVPRFQSVAHHYEEQRRLVAVVPETALRMTAPAIRERLGEWRDLLNVNV